MRCDVVARLRDLVEMHEIERVRRRRLLGVALERVFEEIDEDGNGADENEIFIGVLLIFNRINSAFPFHVNPPTKVEIRTLMKEFDKNRNNKLDQVRAPMEEMLMKAHTQFSICLLSQAPHTR